MPRKKGCLYGTLEPERDAMMKKRPGVIPAFSFCVVRRRGFERLVRTHVGDLWTEQAQDLVTDVIHMGIA